MRNFLVLAIVLAVISPQGVPGAAADAESGGLAPVCVLDPLREHHGVLLYVRRSDQEDRYAEKAPQIRAVLQSITARLDTESTERFGVPARFKVLCEPHEGGLRPIVFNVVNPAEGGSVEASVVGAAGGWNSRIWRFVDHTSGTSHASILPYDEAGLLSRQNLLRTSATIYNVGDYSWLHEILHTLGAVQKSSPNHLSGHCSDGLDIMCYDDRPQGGGSPPPMPGNQHQWLDWVDQNARVYAPIQCSVEVIDCQDDDYYDPTPEPGEYLATHWNIGSPDNCHLWFGPVGPERLAEYEATPCRTLHDADGDGVKPPADCDDDDPTRFEDCL